MASAPEPSHRRTRPAGRLALNRRATRTRTGRQKDAQLHRDQHVYPCWAHDDGQVVVMMNGRERDRVVPRNHRRRRRWLPLGVLMLLSLSRFLSGMMRL